MSVAVQGEPAVESRGSLEGNGDEPLKITVEYDGWRLEITSDDLESCAIQTPRDVSEVAPGHKVLGQAHFSLTCDYKEGKGVSWERVES